MSGSDEILVGQRKLFGGEVAFELGGKARACRKDETGKGSR